MPRVLDDAADERELLEGLRVLAKVSALCTELSVQADPQRPHFFDMCSATRMIGGPNPDGRYLLAAARGDRAYRTSGTPARTPHPGFPAPAGTARASGQASDGSWRRPASRGRMSERRRMPWCCRYQK